MYTQQQSLSGFSVCQNHLLGLVEQTVGSCTYRFWLNQQMEPGAGYKLEVEAMFHQKMLAAP